MSVVHGPVGQATKILKAIPPTIQIEPIDQNSMLQQCSLGTRSDKNRQCTKLHFDQILSSIKGFPEGGGKIFQFFIIPFNTIDSIARNFVIDFYCRQL